MKLPLPTVIVFALVGLIPPVTAAAQTDAAERASRPLFLVGARFDAPARAVVSGGLLFQVGKLTTGSDFGDSVVAHRGLEVEASAGLGAWRLAAGYARRVKSRNGPVLFGEDLLASVTRTRDEPRGATPDSTYVGVEAGLTLIAIRFSAGVAHRVSGPSGPHRTMFIWSVGLRTGW